jgi:magnesium transporter
MSPRLLTNQVRALVASRGWGELRETSTTWPPATVAEAIGGAFSEGDTAGAVVAFRCLPSPVAGEVFAHFDPPLGEALLRHFTDAEVSALLAELNPDDRTRLLSELPGPVVQALLNALPESELAGARALLGYPERSVGRLMTPHYVRLRPDWTVHHALERIRKRGHDFETVSVAFVVDPSGRVLGAVGLRELVMAEPETPVSGLTGRPLISLDVGDDRKEAVRLMTRHGLKALPVLDTDRVLLGIVTWDDVLQVAEEEATEDFHRMAPIGLLGQSLKEAGVAVLWRARVGWLLVLVFMNVFSGAGIHYFQSTLAATLSLTFFLPLLIGSGGNAGSQAATLTVRALATGDVRAHDWLHLATRELLVALALGLTMATGAALIAAVRAPEILAVVSLSMVIIVMTGSLIGTVLPFLLSRLGFDPATASAPLITSLADISGVLIYLSIASAVLAP